MNTHDHSNNPFADAPIMPKEDRQAGRSLKLSLPRRWIGDLLYFARKVPSIPVERTISVASLAPLRSAIADRPSWAAIFTKAMSIVASRHPLLRRCYLTWPNEHLFEANISVASLSIEREYAGESAVFLAQLRAPDRQSLLTLQRNIDMFKSAPIETISSFRKLLRFSRWPKMVRRFVWWIGLSVSGTMRVRRFGTFGISVFGSLGAQSLHPISPLTTLLNVGPIDQAGDVRVILVYDHRVLDGATVARTLASLEQVLNEELLAELKYLAANHPADTIKLDQSTAQEYRSRAA